MSFSAALGLLALLGAGPASALTPPAPGALLPDPAWTPAGVNLELELRLVLRPVTEAAAGRDGEWAFRDGTGPGPRGVERDGPAGDPLEAARRYRLARIALGAPAGLLAGGTTMIVGILALEGAIDTVGIDEPGGLLLGVGGGFLTLGLFALAGPAAVWAIGSALDGRGSFHGTLLGGVVATISVVLINALLHPVLESGQAAAAPWVLLAVYAAGPVIGYEISSHLAATSAAEALEPRRVVRPELPPSGPTLPDGGAVAKLALGF